MGDGLIGLPSRVVCDLHVIGLVYNMVGDVEEECLIKFLAGELEAGDNYWICKSASSKFK